MKKRLLSLLLAAYLLAGHASALTVEQARTLLRENYVADISEEILALPTVEEILAALGDPYTVYYSAGEYQDFLGGMSDAALVGVGVVASMEEAGLTIVQVLPGSPAHQAGLMEGMIITAVDGRAISPQTTAEEAGAWLKGEEGTWVGLTLLLPDGTKERRTLPRRAVTVPRTTYELVKGRAGYLNCQAFGEETVGYFSDAINEYRRQADSWVVDLRANSGGMLQDAADAAGLFLGRTVTGYLGGKDGAYLVCGPGEGVEQQTLYPVIVLTGEGTASAAEMFAGAVRDNGGGLLIGQRTFGKGNAQVVLDKRSHPEYFVDGDAMTISAARFFTAGGAGMDQVGILPHLMVEPEYVLNAALLLSAEDPGPDNAGALRLHLGGWRMYLDLEEARAPECLPAFTALLEALTPDSRLYAGQGEGRWEQVAVERIAAACAPDYTPRTFSDIEDSRYRQAIETLTVYGLVKGDGTGRFHPEQAVTRSQLCVLLAQALDLRLAGGEGAFSDVSADAWYAPHVNALYRLGVIEGCGGGAFRPDDPVTCEQMAVILARTAAWLNKDLGAMYQAGPTEQTLADPALEAYSPWAREGVCLMGRSMQDIFGEYVSMLHEDVAHIDPRASATREEAAMSLYQVLSYCGVLS